MPPRDSGNALKTAGRWQGLIFPLLIVSSVLVLITPLPPLMLDLLLASNVTVAVVILLTTIYVARPLDFNVFPALLLGTTLARLVLNVASTRLILSGGATEKMDAAGGVIAAFGEFVAGGNIVIGIILFSILVIIQFVVITKGATRISEVAARFALDGMPGKQMAIDADLNAGTINQEQAKQRRQEVTQQADFYGAMDGASKFVRGDAIAGIIIMLVNIFGGLFIGVFQNGLDVSEAAALFTKLTIGDGLVSQVPAFLISIAAGMIVTRSSTESQLSRDMVSQMFRHSEAMFVASAFLVALSLTGLPMLPMLTLATACGVIGFSVKSKNQQQQVIARQQEQQQIPKPPEPKPEDNLHVDPMELELGVGLLRLADPNSGGDLLERITRVRHKIAQELGIILPKVRLRDSMRIEPRQYQIKIRDVAVAWGEAYPDALLAIDTGATTGKVPGLETVEPAFQRPARWIEPAQKDRAAMFGYSIVEPSAVIITHLTEIIRENSNQLFTRQQVHQLLDNLKQTSPKVVDELIPDLLKTSQVHQILNNLLRERVPIRDLETILQTLGDFADRTKDLTILTEYVRNNLARSICQQYRDRNRVLRVVTLDPGVEDILSSGIEFGDRGLTIKLSPQTAETITHSLTQQLEKLVSAGYPPVVLCNPQVRAGLKQITAPALPKLAVISLNEITRDTDVESLGQVEIPTLRKTPLKV
ncbi:MAG: flagellar biosynthesis protein FlhA [Planctomycetota bacterium]|nr:flagellar biosynthesis protein FlhA [Planctomycetota bacterium]MDA1211035.1 flagellar biosynthesis protein FlhA [Planctomycetota bacterium]